MTLDGAGDMYRTFEIEAVKRMSHRFQIITGADWTKRDLGADLFSTNPNTLISQAVFAGSHYWDWTGKLVIHAELPWGVNYSSVFKSQKGEPHTRTISVNCDRYLNAGQSCSQAGGRAPAQGSFNLTVEPSGTADNFYPTLTLWDMSVSKQVSMERFGTVEAIFDLFNVANANTIRGWSTSSSTTTNLDGARVQTFRRPSSILNPRIFRLGLRWRF
jgi:hypothetical protein